MQLDIIKPTNSPALYFQKIGRSYRLPINIAASLNKDSIRTMDGMLIIGWINKSWIKDLNIYNAQSIYGGTISGSKSQCKEFINNEYLAHNKREKQININKTRNLSYA